MTRRLARVLVDSPLPQLDRLFDYAIPDELLDAAQPGVRVKVPLRTAGRIMDGYLVELGEEDDADRPLSQLEDVVSAARVLPGRLYRLARRVADRSAGGAADVLRLAIPKRMVRVEKAWLSGPASEPQLPTSEERAWASEALAAYPGLQGGLEGGERMAADAAPGVTEVAEQAVPAWTELLTAAALTVLAQGRSTVIAVPDRRDLDRLEHVLRSRGAARALVRHDAAQSGPERYGGFLRTLEDAPCIVIGNRSAVYAPVTDLGLIALWDDGDPLLEEPLAPSAHPRDAALVRQEQEGCALLLSGHTRTTETERLVSLEWVRQIDQRRRPAPRVILSEADSTEPLTARVPSRVFQAAREALKGGPVLVQVARPGYAPSLVCAGCRAPARCAECGGPLHARARGATPVCSWCGRSAHSWACRQCSSPRLRLASSGSERTADELGRAFPGVRVIIADAAHPVLDVDEQPALVVATRGGEPIARGGYRLVMLLDGERMLQAPQLRIGESCLRWWSNAAALAAPGAAVHLVGVNGPVARALASWTQPGYARSELTERAPLHMPPTVRIARIEGTPEAVDTALRVLREAVPTLPEDAVLGPVPIEGDGPAAARALLRFGYASGSAVTASLRASVISEAMKTRRGPRTRATRNRLAVRVDVPEPEL